MDFYTAPESPSGRRRTLVNVGVGIALPIVGITAAVILGMMGDSAQMGMISSLNVTGPQAEADETDPVGESTDPNAEGPGEDPGESAEGPEGKPAGGKEAVDGCDLLTDEEVSTTFGDTYRKRAVYAGPDSGAGDDPWTSGCAWALEGDPVGSADAGISVHTDTDIDEMRQAYELGVLSHGQDPFAPKEIPDLGDEAWLVPDDQGNGSVAVQLNLLIVKGTTMLMVERRIPFEEGGITRIVDGQLLHLGRRALERLPENPTIDPGEPGPECGNIDTALADVATGAVLLGFRELTTESGQILCSFRGSFGTYLEVRVRAFDDDARAEFDEFSASDGVIRRNSLGDEAYIEVEPGDHSRKVLVRSGEQMIKVLMNCPCVVGASADAPLTEDQEVLLHNIVDGFALLDG